MGKKILFHGSSKIIKNPIFGQGKPYNDYGQGFYCTEHIELAKEWGCSLGTDGYANRYEIEINGLSVLNLLDKKYSILNWLAILMENRKIKLSSPVAIKGREYLIRNFLPDYKDFDIIIGYRADDSYFSFARSFVSNEISLTQLKKAMELGKLGEQFVLKSKKAFESIDYLDYSVAERSIYYAKRKQRDDHARKAYLKEIEEDDIEGIFMRDIIKEDIKNDDPRLR